MRILAELDERQVRLGYVNCVVLVAGRQLDTRTALRRRFDEFVFRKVQEGSAEEAKFLAQIDEEGRRTLEAQDRQRSRKRGGSKAPPDPVAVLRRESSKGRCRYVSHLWLLQRCMPSHLGPLAPERSEVFIEHAKHLGLLAETYALTESGHVLKRLLLQRDPTLRDGFPTPNPLHVGQRLAVRTLYVWALLENDAVTPFLLREFAARRQNDPELLVAAVDGLVESFARHARVDSAMEMKTLREYRDRVAKGTRASAGVPRGGSGGSKRATNQGGLREYLERAASKGGFKIHRHHVRPRLEHYVDVGLLGRRRDGQASETVYRPTPETQRAVQAWGPLIENPKGAKRFLDGQFFAATAHALGLDGTGECTVEERLLYFARAYELVSRQIGFTPGRTVAFAACLLALEEGRIAEVDSMFEAIYEAAKTELGEHLIFSGGSRFDREFLIRVRPEIEQLLCERVVEGRATQTSGGHHERV